MIPVEQTILNPPNGNCMQACVASILEAPALDAVPNPLGDGPTCFAEWNRWLERFGLQLVNFPLSPDDDWHPAGYWIGAVDCGTRMHAVVMHGSELAWNPDPRRAAGVSYPVECTIFVPLDPANLIREEDHETTLS